MVHQTFVWWALYILYKFVKFPIRHLGLAIGNIRCVRSFSPTLWWSSWYDCVWRQIKIIRLMITLYLLASKFRFIADDFNHQVEDGSELWSRLLIRGLELYLLLLTAVPPAMLIQTQLQLMKSPWKTEWATIVSVLESAILDVMCSESKQWFCIPHTPKDTSNIKNIHYNLFKLNLFKCNIRLSLEELGLVAVFQ